MNAFFEMTVSDDLRTVEIIYKGEGYHIWYDQYMGEYYGKKTADNSSVFIGRYEYPDAPDNWCPLPDEQDFKNGFITDRLHDAAGELAQRLNISAPRLAPIYNAQEGRPVRYGDHYRESIPDMWSVYYRNGRYFYIYADNSGRVCTRLETDSEDELWRSAEQELNKLK